ncbi:binding-protein-dependent transport systems inner membrane component [Thermotoga sp. TBGT1765]|uniref:Binding-protein-dependent transport systems inner membrane component n=1 Tax=Thermotoga petrophila (strain ATCC BAA-489 / DSM 13996 / JCM 10882 / RKU-10) TaxID=590168 RepID=D2C5S9_THEP2|nr:binding-protein-dependent transport systems inner membrane component [Thermotoga petrophila RKU-10]AIY87853.1 binding-protein-dependent transport systems inner membrane component [Thermotoga sp. Cell2]KHC91731.1 binding-protein-dependent transport systems inner membrane component [Thermotoga sp. TBGT1765]KHC96194.1 binding-protein-dependent transport systems inner membrane component [Thermotoga sp. Xyl54]
MNRVKRLKPLLLLFPLLAFVIIFFVIPVVLTVVIAFTDMDYSFVWNFVGFQNFRDISTDFIIPRVIANTFIYTFGTLGLFNLGTALLISLLTTSISDRWGNFFRTLWMLPRLTPSVVYGLLWLWMFDPTEYGLVNFIRGLFGLPPQDWLHSAPMWMVIFANGFIGASMGMLVFTAAIKSIPEDYYRAARIDGASWFMVVRRITLPLIKWHLLFVTAYQTLSLLASFEYILIITDGGPVYRTEVWALYTYHNAFSHFRFGYGAALSIILVIIGVVSALVYMKFFGFESLMEKPKVEVE